MGNSFSFFTSDTDFSNFTTDTVFAPPMLNSYATWSATLKALYNAAITNSVVFKENQHATVAYRLKNTSHCPVETELDQSVEPVSIGELVSIIREKMGDELTLKDFKGLDLGGRDCGTIAKVLAGKVSLDKMPKFVGRIALMTGGSLFTRTTRLYNLRNGEKPLEGTDDWFLLDPNTETLLTGLSVLGYLQTNVENHQNTLLVIVGSTDTHFAYIDARGRMRFSNLLGYTADDAAKFDEVLRKLIGDGVVKRILFGGSFLFGLEVRKFLADRDSVEAGVDESDIDFDKMTFISIGDTTGEVLHGKILASRGANADEPENYDFSLVTRSSGKGPELAKFLGMVFNNDFMRHHLEENVEELLSFARTSLPGLCEEDVETMLNGFAEDVKNTRRYRAVMV